MGDLFVDTSGWFCYFVKADPHHGLAKGLVHAARKRRRLLVTTNYVLTELIALLTNRQRMSKSLQVQYGNMMRTQPWIDAVHVDEVLDAEGWQKLADCLDKDWSLVDCVSFALMKGRRITEALTTDHHFEQAGFVRLLK
jgi:uncharacterized protein